MAIVNTCNKWRIMTDSQPEQTPVKSIKIGKYTLPLGDQTLDGVDAKFHDISLEPIEFSFEYQRVRFKCSCFNARAGSPPTFTLTAILGSIPFTAQSALARRAALMIVKAANSDLNGTIRLVKGKIVFGHVSPIETPVSSTILVTAIVTAIARIKPYLTFLAEVTGQ